jgi:hypothetical protein
MAASWLLLLVNMVYLGRGSRNLGRLGLELFLVVSAKVDSAVVGGGACCSIEGGLNILNWLMVPAFIEFSVLCWKA